MSTVGAQHGQEAQRQYEETRRLTDSVTKLLVEMGRMEVRAQERHDGITHTIRNLRQSMDAYVPRREIDQRLGDIQDDYKVLESKHESLRQAYQSSADRQIKIITFASIASTAIGGFITYALRKLGIIT